MPVADCPGHSEYRMGLISSDANPVAYNDGSHASSDNGEAIGDDLWPTSLDDPWDRRSNGRVRITLAVKQQVGERVFLCQSGNLSPGGMFLARAFDQADEPTAKCSLEFGLPGQESMVSTRALIVRQQRRGRYHLMGVRFSSLTPSHRHMISEFLREPPSPEEPQAFETAAW